MRLKNRALNRVSREDYYLLLRSQQANIPSMKVSRIQRLSCIAIILDYLLLIFF